MLPPRAMNGPVLHDGYWSGELTMAALYRVLKEGFDSKDKYLEKLTRMMKRTNQRLAGLQRKAQQPRLVAEADVKLDIKTRERVEGAAADDEKYGEISSARVDDDPMRLTSFGDQEFTEPSLAPEKDIGDVPVDEGAEAPKPHLPPVEMRMLISTASGLLLTGTASTTLRTVFHPQPPSWSLWKHTKKKGNSTTTG